MEGSVRRRAVLSAPFLLIPLVQSQGNASADPGKAALDTFTPVWPQFIENDQILYTFISPCHRISLDCFMMMSPKCAIYILG